MGVGVSVGMGVSMSMGRCWRRLRSLLTVPISRMNSFHQLQVFKANIIGRPQRHNNLLSWTGVVRDLAHVVPWVLWY